MILSRVDLQNSDYTRIYEKIPKVINVNHLDLNVKPYFHLFHAQIDMAGEKFLT